MYNDYLKCNRCNKKSCGGCKPKTKFFIGYKPQYYFKPSEPEEITELRKMVFAKPKYCEMLTTTGH